MKTRFFAVGALLLSLCSPSLAQQAGDATSILTGGLYTLSTGSGGGGGGGTIVQIVQGPIKVKANGQLSASGFTSDVLPLLMQFVDASGNPLSLNGATLTYKVSQFGTTTSSGTVTSGNVYTSTQQFLLPITLPSTQGVARLTVTRTGSASDVQSASIDITVKAR